MGVLRECVTEGSNTDDASQARLTSLAARFEDNVYRSAKTNEEYFHQIANKMYNLKRKKAVPGGDLAKAGASAAAPPPQGVPIGRPTARTDSVLRRPTTRLRDRLRYDRLMIVCCVCGHAYSQPAAGGDRGPGWSGTHATRRPVDGHAWRPAGRWAWRRHGQPAWRHGRGTRRSAGQRWRASQGTRTFQNAFLAPASTRGVLTSDRPIN